MIAAAAPSPESLFHAQCQYIAQTVVQNHAKQCLKDIPAGPCTHTDLTMVKRADSGSYLTNPRFPIESCLDSL